MDMNPLEKIRDGILKRDWALVCKGYYAMTGHNLSSQTNKPDTEDYVAETCGVSQAANDDDVAQPTDDHEFNEVIQTGEKIGLYGNTTVLITEKPTADEIKKNKERAANREQPRVPRPSPKTHKIKCTDCEKTFESRVKAGEFGQKCPKCLRSMSRER